MDCWLVPTENTRLDLKVSITCQTPITLIIKGYDPDHLYSVYFEREVQFFKGTEEFDCPMPISPTKLKICAFSKNGSEDVKINYIKANKLASKSIPFNTSKDVEFYDFIADFCKKAGYANANGEIYFSPSKDFEIKYSNEIYNTDGTLSRTPARTFRPHGEIEVNKSKFQKMTVFMRYHILLHERMHIRANTRNEEKSDSYSVQTYLGLGYPKTEALYSFIKVFEPKNPRHEKELIQRTEKLNNFLKFY